HQLSEKEEQIIMMKDLTGRGGFTKLYDEIESAFMYEFEVDGEKKELTGSEIFAFMYHKDRDVRYRALQTFVSKFKENELIFTHIYNNVLKDWDLETKRKNYEKPISRRNFDNEISDKIVETLGKVTTGSNSIVEKYYNLKKKIIGLDELKMSDIYAPVGEIEKKYTYDEAIDLVKNVNERFLPEFKDIIQKMYELKHIDVTPRKGKTGGAFCSYGRQTQYPFVFVNFTGDIESVLTLAHELGHALHHYYIQQNQTFTNIGSSLAVAEIASVFNEILAFDYLMEQDMSKAEKIALLCNHIEGNFSTSHRQNAFYNFEKRMHELMKTKLPTTQEYKDIYVEEMEKMFGNSVVNIKEDYSICCFVVSHFIHVPFYVYAYNMANLLVIALYQLYLEEKDKFKPKFVKLLSVGTSLTPEQMLAEIGVDLNDPNFWQKGINYLTGQIDKLEELVN
ncbi:MAG: M3 family oligoendopeptidase, partial [Candidatus Heimdallarchaeota archaeon]|nr:M3 family oligoendopeptidase [Candidatus Heimdallarchaeota archaeon]